MASGISVATIARLEGAAVKMGEGRNRSRDPRRVQGRRNCLPRGQWQRCGVRLNPAPPGEDLASLEDSSQKGSVLVAAVTFWHFCLG